MVRSIDRNYAYAIAWVALYDEADAEWRLDPQKVEDLVSVIIIADLLTGGDREKVARDVISLREHFDDPDNN